MVSTGKSTSRQIRCLVVSWSGLEGAPPCILVGFLALAQDLPENVITIQSHTSPTCPNWTEVVTQSHGRGGYLAWTWSGPGTPTVFCSLVCVCGFLLLDSDKIGDVSLQIRVQPVMVLMVIASTYSCDRQTFGMQWDATQCDGVSTNPVSVYEICP